jgi:hypothetical protein
MIAAVVVFDIQAKFLVSALVVFDYAHNDFFMKALFISRKYSSFVK